MLVKYDPLLNNVVFVTLYITLLDNILQASSYLLA